jgi:hypothetical protein
MYAQFVYNLTKIEFQWAANTPTVTNAYKSG